MRGAKIIGPENPRDWRSPVGGEPAIEVGGITVASRKPAGFALGGTNIDQGWINVTPQPKRRWIPRLAIVLIFVDLPRQNEVHMRHTTIDVPVDVMTAKMFDQPGRPQPGA
jgi:hypothetical protein